jgi:hypothetical protein
MVLAPQCAGPASRLEITTWIRTSCLLRAAEELPQNRDDARATQALIEARRRHRARPQQLPIADCATVFRSLRPTRAAMSGPSSTRWPPARARPVLDDVGSHGSWTGCRPSTRPTSSTSSSEHGKILDLGEEKPEDPEILSIRRLRGAPHACDVVAIRDFDGRGSRSAHQEDRHRSVPSACTRWTTISTSSRVRSGASAADRGACFWSPGRGCRQRQRNDGPGGGGASSPSTTS